MAGVGTTTLPEDSWSGPAPPFFVFLSIPWGQIIMICGQGGGGAESAVGAGLPAGGPQRAAE